MEHHIEIPYDTVKWQVINLVVLFGALYFFLRNSVKELFKSRQVQYLHAAEKSKKIRDEAEKQFVDIKHKIKELEASRSDNLERARVEAARLKDQLLDEAKEASERMAAEAKATIDLEIEKAQHRIKATLLKESLETARGLLTKDIGSSDHQKLQSEFVQNVEAVL